MSNYTCTNYTCANYTCANSTDKGQGVAFVGGYSVICVGGLVLNVLALVVFLRGTKTRSHTTVYMMNLAVADLAMVLTLPIRIYYHLNLDSHGLPQELCDWVGLILLGNMYGSIFLLTCICFDRCMAVSFPMSSVIQEGRKKAPLICLGVWALTFGASLPNYLWVTTKGPRSKQCFGNLPDYATLPGAFFSTLIVGFGIPLLVMLVCSWGLLRAIQRSSVAQTELVNSRKIRKMIAASLLLFLVCFAPYHVSLGLVYHYGKPAQCSVLVMYRYSLMVACLNAMLDPIFYYFTTNTFRNKVETEVMRKMFPLNSHTSTEGNNRPGGLVNT